MRQSTLHAYFDIPPRPPITGASFLHLPYDIRHRIYALAGLVRHDTIDMNHAAAVAAPPVPIALLYVSRDLAAECGHVLYAENSFTICHTGSHGFRPLHDLAGPALAVMPSLSIRLNVSEVSGQEKELGRISRNDKATVADWTRLCARLAAHIRPSHLRLTIICHVANYEVALAVVAPLSRLPPFLRACSIRLGHRPDHQLRRLAETTVYHATGSTRANGPLSEHYSPRLPVEIQQQIMGYSALVAPRVLRWECNHGLLGLGHCCGDCSDAPKFCCCPLQHAAFAANCNCWRMPTDLFLISPQLHKEATRIFYQQNIFAIFPPAANVTCVDVQPSLLAFLTSVPSHAVDHLRSIQCIFPPISPAFLLPDTPAHFTWLQTVNFIVNNLHISTLSLTLDMSSDRGPSSDYAYMSLQQILDREDAMWTAYQRILEPLTTTNLHGGLKNLFIHLSWPVDDAKRHIRDVQESILEKRIIGNDYDAVLHGKPAMGMHWNNEVEVGQRNGA